MVCLVKERENPSAPDYAEQETDVRHILLIDF